MGDQDEEEAEPDHKGLGRHVNTFRLYLESSGICSRLLSWRITRDLCFRKIPLQQCGKQISGGQSGVRKTKGEGTKGVWVRDDEAWIRVIEGVGGMVYRLERLLEL